MAVYVDDMNAQFGRMIMCHMIADTEEELHEMAQRIGMNRKWFQNKNHPHYDVSKSKKALAIQYGAKEISSRELIQIIQERRRKELEVASEQISKIEARRMSCNHKHEQLHIGSGSHSGVGGHGRYYIHLCTNCGQFTVFVEENGETARIVFGVTHDDQIEAVLKHRKYLGFEDD